MDDLGSWRKALQPFAELHDIFKSFERYLIPGSAQPLGVAVSGGGDSVALLCLLHLWGKRPLEVFCVNHGLNPHSVGWCAQVEALAERLGHGFTRLDWIGDKPATGIQAAARQARHGLLADAARDKGIEVLCLGHNRDDILEASLMRDMGSSVGAPEIWAPSPVWPQGRGVFIYRPLLNVPRQMLRDWLTVIGVGWVDDPANVNPKFLRSRARTELMGGEAEASNLPDAPITVSELLSVPQPLGWAGILTMDADHLLNLPQAAAHKVVAAAMVSAGGGARLPRSDSVAAIVKGLKRGEAGPFVLSGARLIRREDTILIGREPGDMVRRQVPPLDLAPHDAGVWDGRFEVRAGTRPVTIMAVQGHKGALSEADLARYLQVPAGLRGALPVVKMGSETGNRLVLLSEPDNSDGVTLRSWVALRFLYALGQVANEYDLLRKL
ncbi:tRNA lysidine(34) synthetase TilS [Asticcacaulis sp. ZE23SCel15]|uniref:tRNA lysidine(34) synthetase TilS n=1 Tax=Asticcacaulis sp. ZE23SCel15 TaxID=3059027 RepID=UPI00265DBCC9|nr:tRNA lysidine(34) synthetase TilS [Asticcacaulis sp. ZE23SCel15]WKL55873.1 tRNA lysidine(34) synthetase TilS [Asticcacaulis sp. ZE23SCel15]